MGLHHHHHDLTLGLSFLLGAVHAIEPGHGKTALFVHLASRPHGFWHPLVMGVSTAVSHSVSLFAIAFAVHTAHHMTSGDHHHEELVSTVLQWTSAVIVTAVGLWLLRQAFQGQPHSCCGHHHHHHNRGGSHHACGTISSSEPAPSPATPGIPGKLAPILPPESHSRLNGLRRRFGNYSTTALLGIAVGILPCPSALAAFFTGLSTGTPSQAYAIIGLFAAGIAASLSVTGYLLRWLGSRLSPHRTGPASRWAYLRAGLILGVGLLHLARLTA